MSPGETIRQRREEMGLLPTKAAKDAGMAYKTWLQLEADRHPTIRADTALKVDAVLGWDPGTAAGLWRREPDPPSNDSADRFAHIGEQLSGLEARIKWLEEQPPWAADLIEAARLLRAEDRSLIMNLIWRLARDNQR